MLIVQTFMTYLRDMLRYGILLRALFKNLYTTFPYLSKSFVQHYLIKIA